MSEAPVQAMRRASCDVLPAALLSGSAASFVSSLTLAACGRVEGCDAAGPLNGPSQWLWGSDAPYARGFSVRHTVVGYAIHHLASIFWAVAYESLRPRAKAAAPTIAAAAATAITASIVDYRFTPKRFRPGFEKRISRPSLALVYVAFAAGLAAATLATRRDRS
jgi:hypothetical protein